MSTAKASRLSRMAHKWAPWALPLLLLAVWQPSASRLAVDAHSARAPSAVIAAGVELVRSGEIWNTWPSAAGAPASAL